MEIIFRAAGCAVVGSVLAILLSRHTPELSLLIAIITGGGVLWFSVSICAEILDTMSEIAARSGVEGIYLSPVMKCIGIGTVTHLASETCRDARQGGIASAVELCGALCALYVSLPLLGSLLSVVERML